VAAEENAKQGRVNAYAQGWISIIFAGLTPLAINNLAPFIWTKASPLSQAAPAWRPHRENGDAVDMALTDNNASEREMKRICLNRKNSLFVGTHRGGQHRSNPQHSDQHLQAAGDRYAARPNATAREPAGNADQPDRATAAAAVEVEESAAVRVK
jgi:hypothetical protein